ncbi:MULTISPECIES: outer membrane protein [unclassified Bradyrhizobium]|uniref:outer membrane protein n=1 Tax=unclassified Bradyrhizobium TaxID=2631580 RepID=UPI001FF388DD|nr:MULTISPECIES: outer membrane protein [unclassified Bradyrhizobium]MCJ9702819.1 porin family protein [Bradyrhizobium sp. SHOUNA76]MCJ9730784.1 porin family protein [Bradyrhizobium sp. PRIMUS42]
MLRFASIMFVALGVASAQTALAADMTAHAPAYKAPQLPVAYNWSGFYAGVNVGYGWGDGAINLAPHDPVFTAGVLDVALAGGLVPASLPTNAHGVLGGLQAGYNVQTGTVVWGIEADISGADIKGSSTVTRTLPVFPTIMTTQEQKVDWFGTVRGRIGAAITPDWMIYATGGLAYGHVKASTSIVDPTGGSGTPCLNVICGAGAAESWRVGWTVGGGGEYRLSSNWSVKLEYLYYDLGSEKYTFFNQVFPIAPGPARGFDATANFTGHIARVGLNYKFGSGPVVAKY